MFVSGYLGTENERASGVPYLGDDIYGARIGGQLVMTPKTVLFASGSFEQRDYGGQDPTFLISRTDRQYDLSIGARYLPFPSITVKPQFSYTKNDSNYALGYYDRKVLSVTFRKDFSW